MAQGHRPDRIGDQLRMELSDLLTRNIGDFPAGVLPILAPDEFLTLLDGTANKS